MGNQTALNIANAIYGNAKKIEQLEKVGIISWHLTSDDAINVVTELYDNNVVRFLITGTRSSATVTFNTATKQIVRKKRNTTPWFRAETSMHVDDILEELRRIERLMKNH